VPAAVFGPPGAICPCRWWSSTSEPWKRHAARRSGAARGWSRSVDVVQGGVAGLAARVLDRSGRPIGAISVCCPTGRLTAERQTTIGELVAGAAATLSDVERSA
jgi:DNA-binding IclR family transcriptional regulator